MLARDFQNIVILTGAGASADSGLSTFRDSNGLWENHAIEEVATPQAFAKDPHLVWKFYSLRRENAREAKPNPCHYAIDEFMRYCLNENKKCTLITQNVDGLHERLAKNDYDVLSMHGTLAKSKCNACGKIIEDNKSYLNQDLPRSECCQKYLRPDIVWFGEMPKYLDEIEKKLLECDLFVSIGTSGNVYPAAGFISLAKHYGAKAVNLNMEELQSNPDIDLFIQGSAKDIVPEFFKC